MTFCESTHLLIFCLRSSLMNNKVDWSFLNCDAVIWEGLVFLFISFIIIIIIFYFFLPTSENYLRYKQESSCGINFPSIPVTPLQGPKCLFRPKICSAPKCHRFKSISSNIMPTDCNRDPIECSLALMLEMKILFFKLSLFHIDQNYSWLTQESSQPSTPQNQGSAEVESQ